jgi:hypothetical protein
MSRTKTPAVPDTHALKVLMEEYLEMLREAERGTKKALSLDPHKEEFWDEVSSLAPRLTMIEARSKSIQEEILDLIDRLPED